MAEKKMVQTRKTTGSKSGKRKTTAAKASQSNVNIAAMVKKLTEPLVFGLDIGTRSIVGTVGYRTSTNGFVVVAQESVEHETRAMLDGQIHDIQAVADTIIQVKQKLEQLIGRKLTDVCIAAAGRVLKTVVACAEMHFNYETVVTNEHVYSLDMLGVEKAYDLLRQEQQNEDIHFYCVGYSVIRYYQNDYPITNLEGHKANTIRTELIATFLPDEVVDGLYAAVEKAGLYVANLTLEPIAAMNVAIPEKFRLLNIALVDVGAGTSDISITNDGSIIAYGMIPSAGDEITEALARHYLLDFGEAEKMKCQSTMRKQVTVHDIMGLSHKISSEEIAEVAEPVVREITTRVADRIKELNGGKPVSAVFVVGGGGKMMGFEETLADNLGIPKERVALRGSEVMGQIEFLQKNIKVDSLLVTPVGICLNYYEQKNNFIFVTLNGERIKLYDNSKLTVVDAAMQMGYPNEDLFPKRGKALNYSVNGEKRMKRGEPGDSAGPPAAHRSGRQWQSAAETEQSRRPGSCPTHRWPCTAHGPLHRTPHGGSARSRWPGYVHCRPRPGTSGRGDLAAVRGSGPSSVPPSKLWPWPESGCRRRQPAPWAAHRRHGASERQIFSRRPSRPVRR